MSQNLKVVPDLNETKLSISGETVLIENLKLKNQDLADLLNKKQGNEQILEFINIIELALEIKKSITLDSDIKEMHNAAKVVTEKLQLAGKNAFTSLENLIIDLGNEQKDSSLIKILKTKFMDNILVDLNKIFDITDQRSPLYQLNLKLNSISKELNFATAKKEESKLGTQHGREFNRVMDGIVKKIATVNGDFAEFVNDIPCESGCKIGDEVVKIDSAKISGHEVKIVWEFKAEKGITEQSALTELNKAIKCRNAQAGIFVLAKEAKNEKWPEFMQYEGKRAIVIVDEDNIDELIIRFAYLWSKTEAIRGLGDLSKKIDTEKLKIKLEEAKVAIRGFQEVTKAHTGIETNLNSAKKWLSDSRETAQKIFNEIEEIIKNNE